MIIQVPYLTVDEFKNGDGVDSYAPQADLTDISDRTIANKIRNISILVNVITGWQFEKYEGGYIEFLAKTSFPIKIWERIVEVVAEATDNFIYIDYDTVVDRDVEDRNTQLDGVSQTYTKFTPTDAIQILGDQPSQALLTSGFFEWVNDHRDELDISPDEYVQWRKFLSDNMIDNSIVPVVVPAGESKSQLQTNNFLYLLIQELVVGNVSSVLVLLSDILNETPSGNATNQSEANKEFTVEISSILSILSQLILSIDVDITFANPAIVPVPNIITDFSAIILDPSTEPQIFDYQVPFFIVQKNGRLIVEGKGSYSNDNIANDVTITFYLTDSNNNILNSDENTINKAIDGNTPTVEEAEFQLSYDVVTITELNPTETYKIRWVSSLATTTLAASTGKADFRTVGEEIETASPFPINSIVISPTAPSQGTWQDWGLLPPGATIVGGTAGEIFNGISETLILNLDFEGIPKAPTGVVWAGDYVNNQQQTNTVGSSNGERDSADVTLRINSYTPEGIVTGVVNSSNGISDIQNKPYGVGVGTDKRIWERIA